MPRKANTKLKKKLKIGSPETIVKGESSKNPKSLKNARRKQK